MQAYHYWSGKHFSLLTGILLAEVVKNEHTSHLSFCHYVVWSLSLMSGVLLTHPGITLVWILLKVWVSLRNGKRRSKWVYFDTTPFFAFVRDMLSLLGKYTSFALKMTATLISWKNKYMFQTVNLSLDESYEQTNIWLKNPYLHNVYHVID